MKDELICTHIFIIQSSVLSPHSSFLIPHPYFLCVIFSVFDPLSHCFDGWNPVLRSNSFVQISAWFAVFGA